MERVDKYPGKSDIEVVKLYFKVNDEYAQTLIDNGIKVDFFRYGGDFYNNLIKKEVSDIKETVSEMVSDILKDKNLKM